MQINKKKLQKAKHYHRETHNNQKETQEKPQGTQITAKRHKSHKEMQNNYKQTQQ